MKAFLQALVLVSLCGATVAAGPITIVDTGVDATKSAALKGDTTFAGQFSIGQLVTITSIETFLSSSISAVADFLLYSDNAGLPGAVLFSQSVTVPATSGGWYGATGLNWLVGPGTYWVGFHTLGQPRPAGSPTTPMQSYLTAFGQNPFASSQGTPITFRILGDTATAVPEPATMLLVGAGVAGLAAQRRRRARKTRTGSSS